MRQGAEVDLGPQLRRQAAAQLQGRLHLVAAVDEGVSSRPGGAGSSSRMGEICTVNDERTSLAGEVEA